MWAVTEGLAECRPKWRLGPGPGLHETMKGRFGASRAMLATRQPTRPNSAKSGPNATEAAPTTSTSAHSDQEVPWQGRGARHVGCQKPRLLRGRRQRAVDRFWAAFSHRRRLRAEAGVVEADAPLRFLEAQPRLQVCQTEEHFPAGAVVRQVHEEAAEDCGPSAVPSSKGPISRDILFFVLGGGLLPARQRGSF